jgi:hypothetical protein
VMTVSWGPSWGKQLPGERPRETAPPLSGAEEQTARAISAYVQYACLLPLHFKVRTRLGLV